MDNERLKEVLLTMTDMIKRLQQQIDYLDAKVGQLEREIWRLKNETKED